MRKLWYLTAVAPVAAMTILAAGPASAANNVLTLGSTGGAAAAVGDTVTANLASGTVATFANASNSSQNATCSVSQLTATVTSNPAAPGTATESLTGQTFSSCSPHGIFGVNSVNSVQVQHLAFNTTVDSSGAVTVSPGSNGAIQTTVSLGTILGTVNCTYQSTSGSLTGTASNATNSITLSGQRFTKSAGSNLCFASATLTARYSPVTDGGQGVFVN